MYSSQSSWDGLSFPAASRCAFLYVILCALPALSQDFKTLLNEGRTLTPANAAALEKMVEAKPEDITNRARLLGFYSQQKADTSHQSRLRHIEWLIGNHPASPLLYTDVAAMTPADFQPPLPGDYAGMVAAWQLQVQRHPAHQRVLANAVNGLYQVEHELTVECLKRLRGVDPTNPRWPVALATLYLDTITGTAPLATKERATAAHADLEASTDLPVIGMVGSMLYNVGKKSKAQPLADYGATLLKSAQKLDPLNPRWTTSASEDPHILTERDMWPYGKVFPMSVPEDVVKVPSETQSSRLIHQIQPSCAPKSVCPQTQKLSALIGKDGHVETLHAVDGDMSTIPPAMDAAREWIYKPALVDGKPVEVLSEIAVVFTPAKKPAAPAAPKAAPPAAPNIVPPVMLTRVEPDFSPEARAAKATGDVRLSLIVDENGLPRDVKVVRSVGYGLDEKAIEAVRKWTFRAGTKDGKPAALPVVVELSFKLR